MKVFLEQLLEFLGTLQANEVLKQILNIGKNLDGKILILDLLKLVFEKQKLQKRKMYMLKK